MINALNVKRGYWRIPPNHSHSSGVSPLGSTPESATYASSAAGQGQSSSASGSNKGATVRRMDSDSPRGAFSGAGYGSTGDGPRRSEMRRSSSAKDVEAQVTCQSVQEQSKAQGLQTFPPTVDLAPDVGKMFDSHSTIMNGQRASFWGTHPVEGGSIAKSKSTPKVEKRFDSIPSVVFEQKQGSWTGNWGSRPQGDEPVQSGPVNAHSHVYTTMPEAEAVAKT